MKKILFLLLILYSGNVAAGYRYSYIPKNFPPILYNFLYHKKEKCSVGERYDYPERIGVCASCPRNTAYVIDETQNKAVCVKCPEGTLPVKRDGYPMCLSFYPVVEGKARKPDGENVPDEEIERMATRLSAEYKKIRAALPEKEEKTFNRKEKLVNVCPSSYPEDETAQKQIDICRRLADRNDFLCPYVEKDAEGKWTCRACTRNTPYKSEQGGCFNCPYGEEMVSSDDGKLVCASEAPPRIKQKKKDEYRPKRKTKKKKK